MYNELTSTKMDILAEVGTLLTTLRFMSGEIDETLNGILESANNAETYADETQVQSDDIFDILSRFTDETNFQLNLISRADA